jgi:hypothetical protein
MLSELPRVALATESERECAPVLRLTEDVVPGHKSASGKSNVHETAIWKHCPWCVHSGARHSMSFSLIDCILKGVDRMQRNFGPMRKQVEAWQRSELTDVEVRGIPTANDLESFQRVHVSIQGTGPDPTI